MNGAGTGTQTEPRPSELLGPPPLQGPYPKNTTEEFLNRHRRLRYVMDFYRSKECVMKNSRMDYKHRVLEAVKLTAWANQRDYASDLKGRPLLKTEIAEMVGCSTQRVSEALEDLESEFLVRVEDRITFVIDDPETERKTLQRRTNGEPNSSTSGKSEEKAKALDFWKTYDPDRFQQYQIVDEEFRQKASERRRLENEAIEAYRAFVKTQSDETENASRTERETVSPNGSGNNSQPARETGKAINIGSRKPFLDGEELTPPTPSLTDVKEGRRKPDPPPQDLEEEEPELWRGLLFATAKAGMVYAEGQVPRLKRRWQSFTSEERVAAIAGIEMRLLPGGEFTEAAYVPKLVTYLRDKGWTAKMRPPKPPNGSGAKRDAKTVAREQFTRLKMKELAEHATRRTDDD